MMTAREEAKEAVKAYCRMPGNYTIEGIADAASNVWEPYLRKAVAFVAEEHPGHYGDCSKCDFVRETRLALGDG